MSLWDNFKHTNICIIGMPEGEEKEQEIGNIWKNKENFPNLAKEIDIHVQELQSIPYKLDSKKANQDTS